MRQVNFKKIIFLVPFTAFFSLNVLAENIQVEQIKAEYTTCIQEQAERVYLQVTCRQKINFDATNKLIKNYCDQVVLADLPVPNSQVAMNTIRNLNTSTADIAVSLLSQKQDKITANCRLGQALRQQIRRSNLDIELIEDDGVL